MKTINRLERVIRRFEDDPAGIDPETLLADIRSTIRSSVMLVQDLGSGGLHAELHESEESAFKSLGKYVMSQWFNRDGPGHDVPIPKSIKRAIDIYYNPDLGGQENQESYEIIPT